MEKQPPIPIRLTTDHDNEETEETNHLVIEVNNSLNQLLESPEIIESEQSNKLISIYKIPNFMRETNHAAFEPQLVSFGPYHHGKEHLLPMELEKRKAFHRLKTTYGLNVESIVKRVSAILEDLFGSYNMVEEKWRENPCKFLKLMIVDGCFMVDFFVDCPTSIRNTSVNIKRDMLLLENQLPLKLLEELHSLTDQNEETYTELISLICDSLSIPGDELIMKQCYHILDMYKVSLLYPGVDKKDRSFEYSNYKIDRKLRPITRLQEAGIKLKMSKTSSLTDVWFKQGELRLPQFIVHIDTELTLSNVMAFETLHKEAGNGVTSFITLMSNLINGDRDVALLNHENVVLNLLGSHQDVADMFRRLGSGVVMALDSDMAIDEHCRRQVETLLRSKPLGFDLFLCNYSGVSAFDCAVNLPAT